MRNFELKLDETQEVYGKPRTDLLVLPKGNSWLDERDSKRKKYVDRFYDQYQHELEYRCAIEETELVHKNGLSFFRTKALRLLDVKMNYKLKNLLRMWGVDETKDSGSTEQ